MERELEQRGPRNLLKIVLFGPESTGKTTLARQLAVHYGTSWVPEYMREYLQEKWDREKKICEPEDLLPIAKGQMELENQKTLLAKDLLFCDTNLLELVVYSRAYYEEFVDSRLLKPALKAQYDLYFLTYIDFPWVEDDLRDRPQQRDLMFERFKNALDFNGLPYVILRGSPEQRFSKAVQIIDQLKKNKIEL